jgi:hypothetical protein
LYSIHEYIMYNIKIQKMGNQQLYSLTNNEIQLLLSLYFGDGTFSKQSLNGEYSAITSCIYNDSLEYKKSLLTTLSSSEIVHKKNPGYKKDGMIYRWNINTHKEITNLYLTTFEEKLEMLDELGLALWFYDDGSLHKKALFYNLCTHAFTIEQQELILKKLLNFGIKGHLLKEKKKDGRVFYYISVNKCDGAHIVSQIMAKVKIESMSYKLWSSTTIQEWSTLLEEWKSKESDKTFTSFVRSFNAKKRLQEGKKGFRL